MSVRRARRLLALLASVATLLPAAPAHAAGAGAVNGLEIFFWPPIGSESRATEIWINTSFTSWAFTLDCAAGSAAYTFAVTRMDIDGILGYAPSESISAGFGPLSGTSLYGDGSLVEQYGANTIVHHAAQLRATSPGTAYVRGGTQVTLSIELSSVTIDPDGPGPRGSVSCGPRRLLVTADGVVMQSYISPPRFEIYSMRLTGAVAISV